MLSRSTLIVCALLLGLSSGCSEPSADDCPDTCEHGRKTDVDGNTYCECREVETCSPAIPVTFSSPVTGECIAFPTRCDVPSDFTPCCRFNNVVYEEGDVFENDCNTCQCRHDGHYSCTAIGCLGLAQEECETNGGVFLEEACTECGPVDECLSTSYLCTNACDEEADCEASLTCTNGACQLTCG